MESKSLKVTKYVVDGRCYDSGDQDHDGITYVNEVLDCKTLKEAKLRFKQIVDYYTGMRNRFDGSVCYHEIELQLKHQNKVLVQAKLRHETYFKKEVSVYHKGRGWIDQARWKKDKHKKKRYKDRIVVTSSGSSYFNWLM